MLGFSEMKLTWVSALFAFADDLEGGCDFFLHFLAGLEFHGSACRDGDIFTGVFRIATDLRFHLTDLESTEVPHDDGVTLGERICDFINEGLDDFQDILLGDFEAFGPELVGDFDDEFAFCDSGHGWEDVEIGGGESFNSRSG